MGKLSIYKQLDNLAACDEALAWVKRQKGASAEKLWNTCKEPSWLTWYLDDSCACDEKRVALSHATVKKVFLQIGAAKLAAMNQSAAEYPLLEWLIDAVKRGVTTVGERNALENIIEKHFDPCRHLYLEMLDLGRDEKSTYTCYTIESMLLDLPMEEQCKWLRVLYPWSLVKKAQLP